MNAQQIYKLASELTEKEVNNIIASWEDREEKEALRTFSFCVRSGDSKQLACATAMAEKYRMGNMDSELYRKAYTD